MNKCIFLIILMTTFTYANPTTFWGKRGLEAEEKNDIAKAVRHYKKAVKNGDDFAKTQLEKLSKVEKNKTAFEHYIWDLDKRCRIFNSLPRVKSNETVRYKGPCVNGMANGHGVVTWYKHGVYSQEYSGNLNDGAPHGYGVLKLLSGSYSGDWLHGKATGKGTYLYKDGMKEEGSFVEGKLNGKGSAWDNKRLVYKGDWIAGNFNGRGELYIKNGDKYMGKFRNGLESGKGTYIWANGDRYVGEFLNGLKHGSGEVTFTNGKKFIGTWKKDKRNGIGTVVWADGTKTKGMWVNGWPQN
ncbi:MAG: hypothetical protein KC646_06870 [Candidatus Cloacimonetes bacterium]|nr:hypothetical protein [Candidatus Cloacimonadota bacterium]